MLEKPKGSAHSRIRNLMTYGALALVLSGAGIWLAFDLLAERSRILADRMQIAIERSRFMSQWIGTLVTSCDYVLRDVGEKVSPEAVMKAGPGEIGRISAWLGTKVATVPGVQGIAIYGPDLVFRASNPVSLIGFRSNQATPKFKTGGGDDKATLEYVPAEKSANRKPAILATRNVFAPDGAFRGGVLAAINLGITQQWIENLSIGPHDLLAIMDAQGIVLARNPLVPDEIGKETALVGGIPGRDGSPSTQGFITTSPVDGRQRIFGTSDMDGIPIVVIAGYDLRDLLEDWQRRAWQFIGGFILVTALSLIVVRALIVTQQQREALRTLATTDSLTGVANRKLLFEAGERETERLRRHEGFLSVMMLDIDHFKSVNDSWGHPTGDLVLKAFAGIMSGCVRGYDIIGRIGGEEFVVLLPATGLEGATAIAERIRAAVQETSAATAPDGRPVSVTVSIGVVSASKGEAFQAMVARADQCLYKAKEGGRNRVVTEP